MSVSVDLQPGFSTTNARGSSPAFSSCTPTTAVSATLGCVSKSASNSAGATYNIKHWTNIYICDIDHISLHGPETKKITCAPSISRRTSCMNQKYMYITHVPNPKFWQIA